MKRTLLIITSICTAVFTACNKDEGIKLQDHDVNKMMGIMHQAMDNMEARPTTDDPEIDFVHIMKLHHQGAIEMSKLELKEGGSDTLKKAAQKIITEQQAEIIQFNTILSSISKDNSDPSFTIEERDNMIKMGKTADVQLITGDIDNDFATLMIGHHQTAIDNASAYLHHGNNDQLKTMATNIILAQTKEIEELADWLKENRR